MSNKKIKKRFGLQTDISYIFRDVPIPKKGNVGKSKSVSVVQEKPLQVVESVSKVTTSKEVITPKEVKITTPKNFTNISPSFGDARKVNILKIRKVQANNKRQKIGIFLAIVFLIAMIFVILKPVIDSRKIRVSKFNLVPSVQAESPSLLSVVEIHWPSLPKYPDNLRDPMMPPKIDIVDFSGGFVVSNNENIFVVLKGKIVKEGGVLEGSTIVKITPGSVEFRKGEINRIQKIPQLIINGIVYSENLPIAIIGKDYFKKGDSVSGAKIVEITPNNVTFEVNGERWIQGAQKQKENF